MNAAIADVITAIEKASRGAEVRQKMADALTELNKNALPAVTAADAGKTLVVDESGNWTVGAASGGSDLKDFIEGRLSQIQSDAEIIVEGAFQGYRYWSGGRFSVSVPLCRSVGNYAFYNTGLTSFYGPNVTYVGAKAFENTSLTSISLPNATEFEGDLAYNFHSSDVQSVDLPILEIVPRQAFYECYDLASVNLPMAREIGVNAFGDTAITSISLPSLQYLGDYAFHYCSRLHDLYLPGSTKATLQTTLGTSCYPTVHVPADLVSAYQSDAVWGQYSIVAL